MGFLLRLVGVSNDHQNTSDGVNEDKGADGESNAVWLILLSLFEGVHRHWDHPDERDEQEATGDGWNDHQDFDGEIKSGLGLARDFILFGGIDDLSLLIAIVFRIPILKGAARWAELVSVLDFFPAVMAEMFHDYSPFIS